MLPIHQTILCQFVWGNKVLYRLEDYFIVSFSLVDQTGLETKQVAEVGVNVEK